MSKFIHKKHNVSVLMYHIVCPTKYRRAVFAATVDAKLKEICAEIQKRYEISFLEIGTDDDHVHFLVQSVPLMSPKQIVQIIKSITAREVFKAYPEVKQYLWGGKFWSEGYFVSTVGAHGNEQMIKNYVQQQGKLEDDGQLRLF
jgi:REP element-mobilizing transposase RayT